MNYERLNEYILNYLEHDKTKTALMLSGDWGTGKSYYIENQLMKYMKKQNKACIVISLYGMENVSDLNKALYIELRLPNLLGDKPETFTTGRIIAKTVIKNIFSMAGINLSISEEDFASLCESVNLNNKLIVLEDFERTSINYASLLGYVNNLVEHDNAKVLLIANEKEIIRQNDLAQNAIGTETNITKINEEWINYQKIREKTIGTTISFRCDIKSSILSIVEDFRDATIKRIHTQKTVDEISNILKNNCSGNLRVYIFSVQKTIDIIRLIGTNREDKVYWCLLLGILIFVSKMKQDIPSWDSRGLVSSTLGSKDYPLLKIAYDYIKWQDIDKNEIESNIEKLKEYFFIDGGSEYKDYDLKELDNYYESTEERVYDSLKNIEKKLETREEVGIKYYCKLAYYFTFVSEIVGFDGRIARELMINNIKEAKKAGERLPDNLLDYKYEIYDEENAEKYSAFYDELYEAMYSDYENGFSYDPTKIDLYFENIHKELNKYIVNHTFLGNYNIEKIVEMIRNSTSEQISKFRNVLFTVYRDSSFEFDAKEYEIMSKLVDSLKESDTSDFDKIQMLQFNYLISNLEEFIDNNLIIITSDKGTIMCN